MLGSIHVTAQIVNRDTSWFGDRYQLGMLAWHRDENQYYYYKNDTEKFVPLSELYSPIKFLRDDDITATSTAPITISAEDVQQYRFVSFELYNGSATGLINNAGNRVDNATIPLGRTRLWTENHQASSAAHVDLSAVASNGTQTLSVTSGTLGRVYLH